MPCPTQPLRFPTPRHPGKEEFVATFKGNEFFCYDLSHNPIQSSTDEITLAFRTLQRNGLMLHTGKSADYVNLSLKSGAVWLVINLGSGAFEALVEPVNGKFNDNAWHDVRVTRNLRQVGGARRRRGPAALGQRDRGEGAACAHGCEASGPGPRGVLLEKFQAQGAGRRREAASTGSRVERKLQSCPGPGPEGRGRGRAWLILVVEDRVSRAQAKKSGDPAGRQFGRRDEGRRAWMGGPWEPVERLWPGSCGYPDSRAERCKCRRGDRVWPALLRGLSRAEAGMGSGQGRGAAGVRESRTAGHAWPHLSSGAGAQRRLLGQPLQEERDSSLRWLLSSGSQMDHPERASALSSSWWPLCHLQGPG